LTRREGWSLIEMSYLEHNRKAWDRQAAQGSRWATPVGPESIRRAREGDPVLILTPNRPVPRDWLGDVGRKDVLCLASGGGQQAPLFAAAGARVVSFDLSEQQLDLDRLVAEREGLSVRCIKGDMADLSELDDAVFDLVFNPVSNVFVPDVGPVWRECYRVLRPGGELLAGFMNPSFFLFDHIQEDEGQELVARYRLPYSELDLDTLSTQRRQEVEGGEPMEFSHSLEAQIGGQLAAGFTIIGFFEDWWDDEATPLNRLSPTSMATRARKPLT
jgi:SAM-dependent methyltransferase